MTTLSDRTEWRTIHRALLPPDQDDAGSRMPLYVRGGERLSRMSTRIGRNERVSLATYFGALPAAYWFAHTGVRRVRLSLHIDDACEVEIRRTDVDGMVSTLRKVDASSGELSVELSLTERDAWLWCEVIGGPAGGVLRDIRWQTADPARTITRITVGVTTFDREADCTRLLVTLASDPDAMALVDRVVVTDQGSRLLRESAGFRAAADLLGDALSVIEQPNLGGSGGFSRGMAIAADIGSTHVLLLDDDVDLEPESLVRLARFSEYSKEPLIVGAQMLSLVEPTRLHSFGERVDRSRMWWTPVEPILSSVDLATATFESTPALSRRIDVDFNGWWMCLVPVPLVRSAGASLPLFIKWDDAEFGLRAESVGVSTVTLPGAALWHMPWTAKDDGLDWQAYFQLRNRVVTALLHGGRGVLTASLPQDINHVLCAQYGSVALRNLALQDVLSGPAHLEAVLVAGPSRATAVLSRYGQVIVANGAVADSAPDPVSEPRGGPAAVRRLARVLVKQVRRPSADATAVRLSRAQGKWWALGIVDRALVEAASGAGVFVAQRDRAVAWREARRALAARWRLAWAWRRLKREYRAAAPTLASVDFWQALFADPGRSGQDAVR